MYLYMAAHRGSHTFVADKIRIQKSLRTSHPDGITPVLCSFASEHDEASFLAVEIKRLVANMGGMLRWGDFVVLREPTVYLVFPWFSSIF